MADFYINADTFDLATSIYVDIALSTLAPDGFYSMDNGYRQQVGGVLLSGITTCDDPIVANNDSYSSIVTAGMNGNNILANDTVNGVPATTGNVQIAQVSSTNANVNINTSNGAVVVNTIVPVGTYSIVYRICQLSNITNCATANISVNVTPLTIQHCYNFDTTCELACNSGTTVGNNYLISDCGNSNLYNADKGSTSFDIGDVIEFIPTGHVGLPRCGTITDTAYSAIPDSTITGLQRACDDNIHCDLS